MTDMAVRNRFTGGAGYAPLTEHTIGAFLESSPHVSNVLGGSSRNWSIREVGDGNLNLVFIVKGPSGGVCVKQALPYVRLVGESWPLPIDRAHFEHEALKAEAAVVPNLVPKIYLFDKVRAAIVMELLEPHIILRKGLIQGIRYPKLADDIAAFAAQTLFSTSDLALPAGQKRDQQSMFSLNTELCRITEDLDQIPRSLAHRGHRRCVRIGIVRGRGRTPGNRGLSRRVHGPSTAGLDRLRRRKNGATHSGPCPCRGHGIHQGY
jgi:5-methylthioribose kinase